MKNMMRGVVWVVMGLWAGPAWAQSVVITPSPIPAVSAGCVLQVQSISPTVWICGSAGSGSVTSTGTLTADTLTAWSSSGVLKNSVVTQSGTVVSAPTFNATTAITLNGTNINTTGALGNVVYVSTAPVLTGTNFTGIPAAAVTGTAAVLNSSSQVFTAAVAGEIVLGIRNTSNNAAAATSFYVGNDTSLTAGALVQYATTTADNGNWAKPSSTLVYAAQSGGLSLAAANASGNVRIYSRNNLAVTFGANQIASFSSSIIVSQSVTVGEDVANGVRFSINYDSVEGKLYLDRANGTLLTFSALYGIRFKGDSTTTTFEMLPTITKSYTAMSIPSASKFYLDGGGDTYITESGSNVIDTYANNTLVTRLSTGAFFSYGTVGIGFYGNGTGTSTGTNVVRNAADGYLYLTSSSRRFKENISTAVLTDDQLDAFIATTPSWWDYTGQQNGALGFIAEDLAALPLDRYGFNPLVNYDKDGLVESNRDYAVIAMQHLVIQRLERKVSALEHTVATLGARLDALVRK